MEQDPSGEAGTEKTPQETPEKVQEEHPKMPEHPGRDSDSDGEESDEAEAP